MTSPTLPRTMDCTCGRRQATMPLTRRAVAAGVIAAACGVALRANSGLIAGDAAAAPTAPDVQGLSAAEPAASPGSTAQVIVENFTFSPDVLTVPVGTTVTWENRDDVPHTVTSDDKGTFASDLLDTGDRFSYRFTAPGTYPYFCSVHPMMTAKVVVQS